MRGVKTDFIHESFHLSQFSIVGGFCSIEMNMVIRTEMILKQPAVTGNPVETKQRFAPCYSCAESAHILCFLNYLGRYINRAFICIYRIDPLSFAGEGAVPA